MQKTLMDTTSYLQLYLVEKPDYLSGIQAVPKLTHGFVNPTIW